MTRIAVLVFLATAGLASAQEYVGGGDFLTDYEVDVIRANQGVKERIEAYVKFAALRLELIDQTFETDEAGRGAKVHRALDEYGLIIEAIDSVIDDALLRNRKLDGVLASLLEAEREFAARLALLAAEPEEDAWRYEFVLEDAILITQDSMELLAEDLGDRKREVVRQEEIDKRRQNESMAPERRREVEQARQEEASEDAERKRKRPSLLRPGEKLGER